MWEIRQFLGLPPSSSELTEIRHQDLIRDFDTVYSKRITDLLFKEEEIISAQERTIRNDLNNYFWHRLWIVNPSPDIVIYYFRNLLQNKDSDAMKMFESIKHVINPDSLHWSINPIIKNVHDGFSALTKREINIISWVISNLIKEIDILWTFPPSPNNLALIQQKTKRLDAERDRLSKQNELLMKHAVDMAKTENEWKSIQEIRSEEKLFWANSPEENEQALREIEIAWIFRKERDPDKRNEKLRQVKPPSAKKTWLMSKLSHPFRTIWEYPKMSSFLLSWAVWAWLLDTWLLWALSSLSTGVWATIWLPFAPWFLMMWALWLAWYWLWKGKWALADNLIKKPLQTAWWIPSWLAKLAWNAWAFVGNIPLSLLKLLKIEAKIPSVDLSSHKWTWWSSAATAWGRA